MTSQNFDWKRLVELLQISRNNIAPGQGTLGNLHKGGPYHVWDIVIVDDDSAVARPLTAMLNLSLRQQTGSDTRLLVGYYSTPAAFLDFVNRAIGEGVLPGAVFLFDIMLGPDVQSGIDLNTILRERVEYSRKMLFKDYAAAYYTAIDPARARAFLPNGDTTPLIYKNAPPQENAYRMFEMLASVLGKEVAYHERLMEQKRKVAQAMRLQTGAGGASTVRPSGTSVTTGSADTPHNQPPATPKSASASRQPAAPAAQPTLPFASASREEKVSTPPVSQQNEGRADAHSVPQHTRQGYEAERGGRSVEVPAETRQARESAEHRVSAHTPAQRRSVVTGGDAQSRSAHPAAPARPSPAGMDAHAQTSAAVDERDALSHRPEAAASPAHTVVPSLTDTVDIDTAGDGAGIPHAQRDAEPRRPADSTSRTATHTPDVFSPLPSAASNDMADSGGAMSPDAVYRQAVPPVSAAGDHHRPAQAGSDDTSITPASYHPMQQAGGTPSARRPVAVDAGATPEPPAWNALVDAAEGGGVVIGGGEEDDTDTTPREAGDTDTSGDVAPVQPEATPARPTEALPEPENLSGGGAVDVTGASHESNDALGTDGMPSLMVDSNATVPDAEPHHSSQAPAGDAPMAAGTPAQEPIFNPFAAQWADGGGVDEPTSTSAHGRGMPDAPSAQQSWPDTDVGGGAIPDDTAPDMKPAPDGDDAMRLVLERGNGNVAGDVHEDNLVAQISARLNAQALTISDATHEVAASIPLGDFFIEVVASHRYANLPAHQSSEEQGADDAPPEVSTGTVMLTTMSGAIFALVGWLAAAALLFPPK